MNGPRFHGRGGPFNNNTMNGRRGGGGRPPMMRRGGPPPPLRGPPLRGGGPPPLRGGGGRIPPPMMGGPRPPPPHYLPPPPPVMRGGGGLFPAAAHPSQRYAPGRSHRGGGGGGGRGPLPQQRAPFHPHPPPHNAALPPHTTNTNNSAPSFHQQQQPHHPRIQQQQATNYGPQKNERRPSIPSSFSQEQIDQAWTSHTPPLGGKTFYYNAITKASVYEMPEALRKLQPQPTAAAPTTTTKAAAVWKEYLDAKSGKKYYSNGTTTTWEIPPELASSFSTTTPQQPAAPPEQPTKKKRKLVAHNFATKEESIAAFKGLLLSKQVAPTAKWNDAMKLCQSPRWDACEAALTVGERKQALAEYQTKRANELRALERQEKARAKESFLTLLTTTLPVTPGFSAWTSRWDDMRDVLVNDDRFHTVADEDTRESLFLDFCEEFKKNEERKKRNRKKEAEESFKAFLTERQEEGRLSFASTWGSFVASLPSTVLHDRRFVPSEFLTEDDREIYFADFVLDLQAAEDDKRNRIRGARKRAEKAQREAFEKGLRDLATQGKLLPSSRWSAAAAVVEDMPSYGPVQEQDPDVPRQLFEQFIAEWVEVYRRDRDVLRQLLPADMTIDSETSFHTFSDAMMQEARTSYPSLVTRASRIFNTHDPITSAKLYLRELTGGLAVDPLSKRRPSIKLAESSEDEGEIVEEDDEDGTDL